MKLTAKKLIMDLASAATGHTVSAKAVVLTAGLFDITENSARVELARLQSVGLLERAGRGRYRLANQAEPVQRFVTSWRTREESIVSWDGRWSAVFLTPTSQIGRPADRRRRWALDFLGLKELDAGLWIRPTNSPPPGGAAALRETLSQLGLDATSRVFALDDLDKDSERAARRLWNKAALTRGYRAMERQLKKSARRLPGLSIEEAVVESFLVGGRAITLLVLDPLLPEELVPAKGRHAVLTEMKQYDELGRSCWQEFAEAQGIPDLVQPLHRPVEELMRMEAGSS